MTIDLMQIRDLVPNISKYLTDSQFDGKLLKKDPELYFFLFSEKFKDTDQYIAFRKKEEENKYKYPTYIFEHCSVDLNYLFELIYKYCEARKNPIYIKKHSVHISEPSYNFSCSCCPFTYTCAIKFYDENNFNCARINNNHLTIIEEKDNNTTTRQTIPLPDIFKKDVYTKMTNDLQILKNDVKYFILCNKAHAIHPGIIYFARQKRLKAYSQKKKKNT